jgi:ubiquinone/menaquinone biosynthesis C-methylase UbiE
MSAKDLFSENAVNYASFRPDYPPSLYHFIFDQVKDFYTAWDCATGNGQAAKVLSDQFDRVYATDISGKQMANGYQATNIVYSVSPAEKTSFPDQQFDLITVAQAAHWFRLPDFYKEVYRVAKADSVIALWGYGVLSVNPDFDTQLNNFYQDIIGPYWDVERNLIDQQYRTIPFPFDEISVPDFQFIKLWNRAQLEGYLNTWSAVQKFIQTNSFNPVTEFMRSHARLLDDGSQKVRFPLFVRIGRVRK